LHFLCTSILALSELGFQQFRNTNKAPRFRLALSSRDHHYLFLLASGKRKTSPLHCRFSLRLYTPPIHRPSPVPKENSCRSHGNFKFSITAPTNPHLSHTFIRSFAFQRFAHRHGNLPPRTGLYIIKIAPVFTLERYFVLRTCLYLYQDNRQSIPCLDPISPVCIYRW